MSTQGLKTRLAQLEAQGGPVCKLPALRIIQRGPLTAQQAALVAEAEDEGRLIIIREIVSPKSSGSVAPARSITPIC